MKSENNILKNAVFYLSGPMEKAKDHGRGWRENLIEKTKHLNIKLIDPTNKPSRDKRYHEEKSVLNQLKDNEMWDELTTFVKGFRRVDLRYTDLADAIIVYIDTNLYTVGTWDEVFTAERQRKPILAIVKGGKKSMPAWLFAVIDYHNIFESVDELVIHLEKLDSGQIPLDKKWVLIREFLTESK